MPVTAHQCPESGFQLTSQMKKDFDKDGFLVIRELLSQAEVAAVYRCISDGRYQDFVFGVTDEEGGEVDMTLWANPGTDVVGAVSRCEKIAGTSEQLLEGDVYHYHSKVVTKRPDSHGKHHWHQDYGYWYDGGFARPDMLTAFIPVTECYKDNGCLQVLKGSQVSGRLNHSKTGQFIADLKRVEQLAKVYPLEYVEMEPGDVMFFHCNLLHCSGNNESDNARRALLCAYSRTDNVVLDVEGAEYNIGYGVPLIKVANSEILACPETSSIDGKDFLLMKHRSLPTNLKGKAQKEA